MSKYIWLALLGVGGYLFAKSQIKSYAAQNITNPQKVQKIGTTPEGYIKVRVKIFGRWMTITLKPSEITGGTTGYPELGTPIRSPFVIPPASYLKRPRRVERILSEVTYGEPIYMRKFRELASR